MNFFSRILLSVKLRELCFVKEILRRSRMDILHRRTACGGWDLFSLNGREGLSNGFLQKETPRGEGGDVDVAILYWYPFNSMYRTVLLEEGLSIK